MNKVMLILIFIFLIYSASAACSSNYVCGGWSGCVDGYNSRICVDEKCDRKDITERKACGENENCPSVIKCSAWSDCVYTDKVDNFLDGEIKFGGYRTRTCVDSAGCLESFVEENSCFETNELKTERVNECGTEFLIVSDARSEKVFAKLNADSWENKKLDVVFAGKSDSCSECFNGVRDARESGIDCGGDCKKCEVEKEFPVVFVSFSAWVFFALSFGMMIKVFFRRKNEKILS